MDPNPVPIILLYGTMASGKSFYIERNADPGRVLVCLRHPAETRAEILPRSRAQTETHYGRFIDNVGSLNKLATIVEHEITAPVDLVLPDALFYDLAEAKEFKALLVRLRHYAAPLPPQLEGIKAPPIPLWGRIFWPVNPYFAGGSATTMGKLIDTEPEFFARENIYVVAFPDPYCAIAGCGERGLTIKMAPQDDAVAHESYQTRCTAHVHAPRSPPQGVKTDWRYWARHFDIEGARAAGIRVSAHPGQSYCAWGFGAPLWLSIYTHAFAAEYPRAPAFSVSFQGRSPPLDTQISPVKSPHLHALVCNIEAHEARRRCTPLGLPLCVEFEFAPPELMAGAHPSAQGLARYECRGCELLDDILDEVPEGCTGMGRELHVHVGPKGNCAAIAAEALLAADDNDMLRQAPAELVARFNTFALMLRPLMAHFR